MKKVKGFRTIKISTYLFNELKRLKKKTGFTDSEIMDRMSLYFNKLPINLSAFFVLRLNKDGIPYYDLTHYQERK